MRGILTGILVFLSVPAWAKPPLIDPSINPASCLQAAAAAEAQMVIPTRLLAAIAEVESIRADPITRRSVPWPWTINVEGVGHFYETRQAAIDAVKGYQAAGARSIDVGCMQINLLFHPNAFASLEQAFDPQTNAIYAARFLRDLYRQTASWPQAAAFYHSQTPALGADYANNVMARWPSAGRYADGAFGAAGSVKLANYSAYTPGFAAALQSIDRDLARVAPASVAAARGRGGAVAGSMASSRHVRASQQPG